MGENYLKEELYELIKEEPKILDFLQSGALKQVEEEVQKLSDEYERVFNGTQDAMFLIDVSPENEITYRRLNQSHERSTGLTTAMVYGKSPKELFGEELGRHLLNNYMRCIESKNPVTYEEEITLMSGTKTWLTVLSPVLCNNSVVQIIGASRDITDRKRIQEEIFEEKEKLNIILQSIVDGVISLDDQLKINFINASAENITEFTKEELFGTNFNELIKIYYGNDLLDIRSFVNSIHKSETPVDIFNDAVLITKHGSKKRLSGKGSKIKDITGKIFGTVITIQDDTERLKNQEKLVYLSLHDSLTGLFNRAYFDSELERQDNDKQYPLSIIVGDVNGLKLSNDVFGHAEGDRLLITIARILKESCRYNHIVTRWGGDEFSVILPNTTKEEALLICKEIKEKCENSGLIPIKPSIALGVATKINDMQNISKVLVDAEELMYKNKLLEGKKVREEMIGALLIILQKRSIETIEHCKRLQLLASRIRKDFDLTEKEGEYLSIFANLHDIGNISVPKNILTKIDTLLEDEWTEIKKHPEIGYRIAQSTVELVPIADFILSHHERWDGTGYPQGLKGEQIPKLARVLTLMDAYDTITNHRPYRKAKSHEEAIAEIKRCSGTQFDPVFADIFIQAMVRIRYTPS